MTTTQTTRGTSLAKGPVGLVGLLLLAYGVTALIFGDHGFAQHLPNGAIHGRTWLQLEVNGWSGLLFVAAGLLLLLGSPLHWGAKATSLLVGVVLGAAALVAGSRGNGVLGVFAANHVTELVWGAAGILLIVLALLPRVGRRTRPRNDERYVDRDERFERVPLGTRREGAAASERQVAREPVSDRD